MPIKIKEGHPSVADMRTLFEKAVATTPALAKNYNVLPLEVGGSFDSYFNKETNDLWCGFALGLRCAERIKLSATNVGEAAELERKKK